MTRRAFDRTFGRFPRRARDEAADWRRQSAAADWDCGAERGGGERERDEARRPATRAADEVVLDDRSARRAASDGREGDAGDGATGGGSAVRERRVLRERFGEGLRARGEEVRARGRRRGGSSEDARGGTSRGRCRRERCGAWRWWTRECWRRGRANAEREGDFVGHFVVVRGAEVDDDGAIRFRIFDPARDGGDVVVSRARFDEARMAFGTDEDLLFVETSSGAAAAA